MAEELAELMHKRYEGIAKEEGWLTQEKTQVPFNDLPSSNKRTMLRLAEEVIEQLRDGRAVRPKIVCLCGSVRFKEDFEALACDYSIDGWIVVMPNCLDSHDYFHTHTTGKIVKTSLDDLHFAKIRLADLVHIINKDGYIGESTRRELEYAQELGKEIKFSEEVAE